MENQIQSIFKYMKEDEIFFTSFIQLSKNEINNKIGFYYGHNKFNLIELFLTLFYFDNFEDDIKIKETIETFIEKYEFNEEMKRMYLFSYIYKHLSKFDGNNKRMADIELGYWLCREDFVKILMSTKGSIFVLFNEWKASKSSTEDSCFFNKTQFIIKQKQEYKQKIKDIIIEKEKKTIKRDTIELKKMIQFTFWLFEIVYFYNERIIIDFDNTHLLYSYLVNIYRLHESEQDRERINSLVETLLTEKIELKGNIYHTIARKKKIEPLFQNRITFNKAIVFGKFQLIEQ